MVAPRDIDEICLDEIKSSLYENAKLTHSDLSPIEDLVLVFILNIKTGIFVPKSEQITEECVKEMIAEILDCRCGECNSTIVDIDIDMNYRDSDIIVKLKGVLYSCSTDAP